MKYCTNNYDNLILNMVGLKCPSMAWGELPWLAVTKPAIGWVRKFTLTDDSDHRLSLCNEVLHITQLFILILKLIYP